MDPSIGTAAIGSIVSLITAYMTYRSSLKQAHEHGTPAPAQPVEAATGERAMALVNEAVNQHGTEDHKADLVSFERNPERNKPYLEKTLEELIAAHPAVAQQFQTLIKDSNVQTGGVQGTVNVSGGTIHGVVAGVSTGTINYNASPPTKDDDERRGK